MKNETYFWEISKSPIASPFLSETVQFGKENPVFVVDQFSGRQPFLVNKEYLQNRELHFNMFAAALLDSNIVDAIEKRIRLGVTTDGIEELLKFISTKKWDVSPAFYLLEHFAKSSLAHFEPNALRRSRAILEVHAMDDQHFLATNEIRPDPKAIEFFTSSYGVNSLDEVAEARINDFILKHSRQELRETTEAIEICLLKMVLINKVELPKESALLKLQEFMRFLNKDLGIMLAREAHFAAHYFFDRAGTMLGIQSNTTKKRALEIISSTAWDLLLLRIPEISLTESPQELRLSYITTHEKRLHGLAKLFNIEKIICVDGKKSPLIGYKYIGIPDEVTDFIDRNLESQIKLATDLTRKSLNIPTGLKSALENALTFFCKE